MAAECGVHLGHNEGELLGEVKNYLDITWDDIREDAKLSGVILRGMNAIDALCGKPLNYLHEGQGRALLLDYCRYARSGALDDWRKNYQSEILALQLTEVNPDAPEETPTDL